MKDPKKALQRKADTDWSLAVRTRDKVCRVCQSRPTANAHHIIDRRHKAVRLYLPNGLGVCIRCHWYVEALSKTDWANPWGRTDNYSTCITRVIGQELYDELVALSAKRVKYNEDFIRKAHEDIRNFLMREDT